MPRTPRIAVLVSSPAGKETPVGMSDAPRHPKITDDVLNKLIAEAKVNDMKEGCEP